MTDRERIAAALAETLVRDLFEVGLQLNCALDVAESPEVRRRVRQAMEGIDGSIRYVREVVFDIAPSGRAPSQRSWAPRTGSTAAA